ncbi:MAG TPA: hypothetical protein VF466_02445 [Candidatus Saccharimonadales bacterium]
MAAFIEDYSASHYSLGLLFDRTQRFLADQGVPSVGSYNTPYPEAGDAAWDQPPPNEHEQWYGLHAVPEGFPAGHGEALSIATAAPSRVVELVELNYNLHRLVPEASGVLALGSTLRIVFASPYYQPGADGSVAEGALPEPAACVFTMHNPGIAGVDIRHYILRQKPKRDELRADRGIEFDMAGMRHDRLADGRERPDGTLGRAPHMGQREAETLREIVDLLPHLPDRNWLRRLEAVDKQG